MSSREPLWYCHECNAEMRPLMVPDPACASCHGSFVEKMENPQDDPRAFHAAADGEADIPGNLPGGMDIFLQSLFRMSENLNDARATPQYRQHEQQSNTPDSGGSPRVAFQVRGGASGSRTYTFGGSNTLGRSPTREPPVIPTMSDYLNGSRNQGEDGLGRGTSIAGPLMARYLTALMGGSQFADVLMPGAPGSAPGRMGDYVFNQEALDEIITNLMDTSNTNRPVPATEDIIENLPRVVLEHGSPLLEKDCAVCKEQFTTETENSDELIVATLPCKHSFHEPCIMPWLKSSGTCPVCRHALVPQPEHHPTPPAGPSGISPPRSPPRRDPNAGGLFQALFGHIGEGNRSPRSGNGNDDSQGGGSSSTNSRSSGGGHGHIPGSFDMSELD